MCAALQCEIHIQIYKYFQLYFCIIGLWWILQCVPKKAPDRIQEVFCLVSVSSNHLFIKHAWILKKLSFDPAPTSHKKLSCQPSLVKQAPEFYQELFLGTPCILGQSNSTTTSTSTTTTSTTTSTTTTTALQTCALRWIGDVVGLARCSVIATFPHKWQILFSSQISLTKISERLRRDVLNFVQFAWWQLFWHQFSCNLDVLSDWGLGLIHLDLQWIWDRDGLREGVFVFGGAE